MTERKTGITLVASVQALICLVIGTFCFFGGVFLVVADIFSLVVGKGGNLSGIGVIFGLLKVGLAQGFFYGFQLSLLLMKEDPKSKKSLAIFLVVSSLVLLVLGRGILIFPDIVPRQMILLLCGWNFISLLWLSFTKEAFSGGSIQALSVKEKKLFSLYKLMILVVASIYAMSRVL